MNNDYGNLELHKVLLRAMKDIDQICRENNLNYYLHAGTLLGAINHKGFIPWDDDVDITMFYEEYLVLKREIDSKFSDHYYIQDYINDPSYPNNRMKLRIKNTKIFYNTGASEEIFIDIAPLYYAPKKHFIKNLQKKAIEILDVLVLIKLGEIKPSSIKTKTLSLLSFISRKKIGDIMQWLMVNFQNKESHMVGTLCYVGLNPYTGLDGYENDLIPEEGYLNPIYVDFEDTHFMTISTWEKDLVRRYGKNYYLPYPEEKRVTKHDVKGYEINNK